MRLQLMLRTDIVAPLTDLNVELRDEHGRVVAVGELEAFDPEGSNLEPFVLPPVVALPLMFVGRRVP